MRIQGTFPIYSGGLWPRRFLSDRQAMMRRDAVIHGAKAQDYQLIHKIDKKSESE